MVISPFYSKFMNIFVGKLPFAMTSDELEDLFKPFGEVDSAKILTDRETGRSRGFGFVEMSDDDAARAAMEELDGSSVDGRQIVVNEARPRNEGGNRGGYGGGGRGGYGGGYRR